MGGGVSQTLGAILQTPQNIYNSVVKGEHPEPAAQSAPPPIPTPDNSAKPVADAEAQQRKARGAASTIFGGAGGVMGGGNSSSQRMLLGS